MKLSNDWNDDFEWPAISGDYYIVARFRINNPDDAPHLIVRDGDLIIDIDYFDADCNDWNDYPQNLEDKDGYWEIVAWKDVSYPLPPYEYKDVRMFKDLPSRASYGDEKSS